jgi:hypothetical protein
MEEDNDGGGSSEGGELLDSYAAYFLFRYERLEAESRTEFVHTLRAFGQKEAELIAKLLLLKAAIDFQLCLGISHIFFIKKKTLKTSLIIDLITTYSES